MISMATLLPWNFFITPFEYWMTKLQRSDWKNATTVVEETSERELNMTVKVDKETRQMPMTDDLSDAGGCDASPFEFNDLQKFWMSSLGIATMITNLIFCFVTTILAVSYFSVNPKFEFQRVSLYYSPVPFESTFGTPKIRRLIGTFFPFVDSKE